MRPAALTLIFAHNFRYEAYRHAAEQFTIHQAALWDKSNAAALIDDAIVQCMVNVRLHVDQGCIIQ